jgi:hypothetical protein
MRPIRLSRFCKARRFATGLRGSLLANPALQRTNASVAALPLAFAAERQYRSTDKMGGEVVLAFRVRMNRRILATAGLPGAHVLTAIVTSVVRGEATRRAWPADIPFQKKQLDFSLGGMITHRDGAHEHVDWARLKLKPGDTITLEVIETERVDQPTHRNKSEGPTIEDSERRELKRLRKKYSARGRQPSNKPLQRSARTRRR